MLPHPFRKIQFPGVKVRARISAVRLRFQMSPFMTKVFIVSDGQKLEAWTGKLGSQGFVAIITWDEMRALTELQGNAPDGRTFRVSFPLTSRRFRLEGNDFEAKLRSTHWLSNGMYELDMLFVNQNALQQDALTMCMEELCSGSEAG